MNQIAFLRSNIFYHHAMVLYLKYHAEKKIFLVSDSNLHRLGNKMFDYYVLFSHVTKQLENRASVGIKTRKHRIWSFWFYPWTTANELAADLGVRL